MGLSDYTVRIPIELRAYDWHLTCESSTCSLKGCKSCCTKAVFGTMEAATSPSLYSLIFMQKLRLVCQAKWRQTLPRKVGVGPGKHRSDYELIYQGRNLLIML